MQVSNFKRSGWTFKILLLLIPHQLPVVWMPMSRLSSYWAEQQWARTSEHQVLKKMQRSFEAMTFCHTSKWLPCVHSGHTFSSSGGTDFFIRVASFVANSLASCQGNWVFSIHLFNSSGIHKLFWCHLALIYTISQDLVMFLNNTSPHSMQDFYNPFSSERSKYFANNTLASQTTSGLCH